MNQHTPGPWTVNGSVVQRGHNVICYSEGADNWDANARLIAAAPELYALLIEVDPNGHNRRIRDVIHRIDGLLANSPTVGRNGNAGVDRDPQGDSGT